MMGFMSGVNKVILLGHLGGDPEVRYTKNGKAMARFSIATSESWATQEGERQERTEWHRVVVWGKLGELCGQYLSKGRQVYLEGRIQTRSWEDKEGQKRYTTEVVGQTVQFLGKGSGENGKSPHADMQDDATTTAASVFDKNPEPSFGATDDDIPF